MHHLAHDGSRTDNGHLHHQVVKILGLQAGERGHLGAGFNLENAHGVGLLNHRVGLGIVGRQLGQINSDTAPAQQTHAVFERSHHAQAQQVHLNNPKIRTVFFVPLHHHAARHTRILERHHRVQRAIGNHQTTGVLAQMARKILDLQGQTHQVLHPAVLYRQARLLRLVV